VTFWPGDSKRDLRYLAATELAIDEASNKTWQRLRLINRKLDDICGDDPGVLARGIHGRNARRQAHLRNNKVPSANCVRGKLPGFFLGNVLPLFREESVRLNVPYKRNWHSRISIVDDLEIAAKWTDCERMPGFGRNRVKPGYRPPRWQCMRIHWSTWVSSANPRWMSAEEDPKIRTSS
jgi:hypothetical protein